MQTDVVGPPAPGVTEVEVDGSACLYSPTTNDVVVLNTTASDVWYLCDGSFTLRGITERLAAVYDVSPDDIDSDVAATVAEFRRAGLLER